MLDPTDQRPVHLRLEDRVVLVTGGVRGVGAGISAVFADQGARVITCARRQIEGLRSVLDFYLHHPSVSQPVEFFHTSLMSLYNRNPVTLWDVQEEDPAYIRYVTDDGRETMARPPIGARVTGDLGCFVADFQQELLAARGECCECEFFAYCGGYFKGPRKDYSCSGVKTLLRTLQDAGAALRHDLHAFPEAGEGTGR